jgi:O-antigen/teichoic acid export membrane protein
MLAFPLAQALFLQGTALAVGLGSTAEAVASFTAARMLTRTVLHTSMMIGAPAVPEFSAAIARGEHDQVLRIFQFSVGSALAVVLPASIVLLLFGAQIIKLWTHGIVSVSWSVMATLTAVATLGAIWNPISNLIMAMNEQRRFSYLYAIISAVGVFVAYMLSKSIGALGGALSMVLVDSTMVVIIIILSDRIILKTRKFYRLIYIIVGSPSYLMRLVLKLRSS